MDFEFWLITTFGLIIGIVIVDLVFLVIKLIRKRKANHSETKTSDSSRLVKILRLLKKYSIVIANIVVIAVSLTIIWNLFSPEPQIEYTHPSQDQLWESYENPIEIVFDRPIDTKLLEINMSPETDGVWEYENLLGILPMTRKLLFYPNESFWPNEKIMVYISNIANKMNQNKGNEYLLEFESIALPDISNINLEEGSLDVATDTVIELQLNKLDGMYNKWVIEINPEVSYELEISDSASMQISFPDGLHQSTNYTLKIFQAPVKFNLDTEEVIEEGETTLLKEIHFTTVKAPLISGFSPTNGSVLPSADIKIEFDAEMERQSVEGNIQISPEVTPEFAWDESGKVLTITHNDFSLATDYSVTLPKGIKSVAGGIFDTDVIYNFSTIGSVYVTNTYPTANATEVDINSNIAVTFDQPVEHSSAEANFSITPNVLGAFSWNGNTMTFNPTSNFSYTTSYTIAISPNIQTIYGYNSTQNHAFSFTTKPQLALINITWDGQDTAWTCNFAAAKMALSAKGVSVSENQLISIATTQPAAVFSGYYIVGGGNPHKGFVNSYGTYWEPVSKAVREYRPNMVKSGWTLAEACTEIAKGNPIVTWGQNGWSNDRTQSWTATDGEIINGFSGMHSVVIVGCKGDLNNPSQIYIQDPWRKWGSELTSAEFLRRWGYFNYTGMVVY